ncbi:unnamed protein product [Pylaiella littoralis]
MRRSGSGASIGTSWFGRFGGGGTGGSGGRGGSGGGSVSDSAKVVTVLMSDAEVVHIEIVEVPRAVVVDEAGQEVVTTTSIVGMEIMEGFSDHGSYEGGDTSSPVPGMMA